MTRRLLSKKAVVEHLQWMRISDLTRVCTLTERLTPVSFLRWTFAAALRVNWYEVQFVHRKTGVPHRFRIDWTYCRFGGRRPWLICSCGKRVGKLYDGGFCVACRTCLNLRYESQRHGTPGRKYLRACRIRIELGGQPAIVGDFPERPRGDASTDLCSHSEGSQTAGEIAAAKSTLQFAPV